MSAYIIARVEVTDWARYHFEKVGHLREVGLKFGRWLDVISMELRPGVTRPVPPN